MKSNMSCHLSRTLYLFAGGSIDAEKFSILYLCLSKAITPEKEVIKFTSLLAHGRWFSPGTPASSTTKAGF
jgi:hypothetical protein